jgi:hypothetical protein
VQYRLLDEWKVGCAVRTLDEVVERVARLLTQPLELFEMREHARARRQPEVSRRIAEWLVEAITTQQATDDLFQPVCESRSLTAIV